MAPFVYAALLFALLAFIGYPLAQAVSERRGEIEQPELGQRQRLLAEHEQALAALKDLEFEHSVGNLSDQDYAVQCAPYRHKAITILRELDRLTAVAALPSTDDGEHAAPPRSAGSLEARLEDEITRARQRMEGVGDGVLRQRCPRCGSLNGAQSSVCRTCGLSLAGLVICPKCHAGQTRQARFCASCGAGLTGMTPDTGRLD
jgi:hypothetical protein